MSNILIALFAYLIDRVFGEFSFFSKSTLKHPVVAIGEMVSYFEKRFYQDSVLRGFFLVTFILAMTGTAALIVDHFLAEFHALLYIIASSFIASMFIAHKMLYDSVKGVLSTENKKEAISQLVSRDVDKMSDSDIYKADIETYAENLSDGVIAPLFYLLLFGLVGAALYKAINTMDSMVGYRNERYEKYGKAAAILDDIANFVPSRITALLIMLLSKQKNNFSFYEDAKKHESPNAGYPITAMAQALGLKLGGPTYYFDKLKEKATFGDGKEEITSEDVERALEFRSKIDLALLITLVLLYLLLKL
ncbi:MAG: adenosylcobinamide-phosphate synthase CbiB [Campylobacterales bacterium]|nr:adenosylcobinamide-phosphate synthase CbiB [Campylobacterales bacterium]